MKPIVACFDLHFFLLAAEEALAEREVLLDSSREHALLVRPELGKQSGRGKGNEVVWFFGALERLFSVSRRFEIRDLALLPRRDGAHG